MIETFPVIPRYTKQIILCDKCGEEMVPSKREMSHVKFRHECIECGYVEWHDYIYPIISTEWVRMPTPEDYYPDF